MSKCTKQRFPSKGDALTAARLVVKATLDAQRYGAYRCPKCRYSDGRKAWHWGHRRPFGLRRQW